MVQYKVEKKERANITGLMYYSRYGIISYEATASEWSAFFAKVLPSELPNVLQALSAHLEISVITENEQDTPTPEAETGSKKKGK